MKRNYPVLRGKAHGLEVYRGFAPLSEVADMSLPDIYDQNSNPTGTQRDLSHKHAKEAYTYIADKDFGFWTEVFLCVRNPDVVKFVAEPGNDMFGFLEVDFDKIQDSSDIAISRVDGNHRLHYSDGKMDGYPRVDKTVSFCLAFNLTENQEISLFRDINANAKSMNTSHLDNIKLRITPEDQIKAEDPELYMAMALGRDLDSPLYKMVYEGGVEPDEFSIKERGLQNGLKYMSSVSLKLRTTPIDVRYILIRNYFAAVKIWIPEAWEKPTEYIVLRGAGLWAISYIGGEVIDRALSDGKFETADMVRILQSGRKWDWTGNGDFSGYSGAKGARKIAELVIPHFQDDSGVSLNSVFDRILDE